LNQDIKSSIQEVIKDLMDKVMKRVLITDPFIPEKHRAQKPIYAALVPDEIFKGSHFERRFVTPFGDVWEKLAIVVAKNGMGYAEKGYEISGTIKEDRLKRITEVLNSLEHSLDKNKKAKPNWEEEIKYILKGKGKEIPVKVVCDVFVKNLKTGERFAFELKGPLPNSDQTKVSKEKILKLYSMTERPIDEAFYALPYNPYGKNKIDYKWDFPKRWFDMIDDDVVLIGNDFWDKIGGIGTYNSFIEAINEISLDYKERIYREFLCINPPENILVKLD
jgi:hypothetical protein